MEIFSDIAVFIGKPYTGTVTALEKMDAWVVPAERMLTPVKNHTDLALAVIRRLSACVLHYVGLVETLSLRSVEARLEHTLLCYAVWQDGELVVPRREWTTFDEMAVRLGTVRDVLSRAMKTLEAEGLLSVKNMSSC
ncbi:MAG: transcriptional activator FtrB [Chloroflexi bacterium ADurb.Bin120]|nr:MAG: transcriptional activator FtrB [Chloroflexi bacterium ADurb.Bin120]HQP24270.1 Crp/Fnr family transcriptional regulator [Smithellaceae bacterium]